MLEALASVGANALRSDLDQSPSPEDSISQTAALRPSSPHHAAQLESAISLQTKVIVRSHGPAVFIQMDGLNREAVERVKPAAFFGLQTSPGNYQAWVAINERNDKDSARRLRKGTAQMIPPSTRAWPAALSSKKSAPHFPRAEMIYSAPGLIATNSQLEAWDS